VEPACAATVAHLLAALGCASAAGTVVHAPTPPTDGAPDWRAEEQVRELERVTAAAEAAGERARNAITWQPLAGLRSAEAAAPLIAANRARLWAVLGKVAPPEAPTPLVPLARPLPELSDPLGAPDRLLAFEVVLSVPTMPAAGVFASGILVVPERALEAGAAATPRPAVVCQHGLEGLPSSCLVPPGVPGREADHGHYKGFAVAIARRFGCATFAPQAPYRGMDAFRRLQRLANPLGLTLFSLIIEQHAAILDWLGALPCVDADRIGFYGLSYGGKAAMRIPAVLTRYACSACAGDFDDWVALNTTTTFAGGCRTPRRRRAA
jgi:hypothetical protein